MAGASNISGTRVEVLWTVLELLGEFSLLRRVLLLRLLLRLLWRLLLLGLLLARRGGGAGGGGEFACGGAGVCVCGEADAETLVGRAGGAEARHALYLCYLCYLGNCFFGGVEVSVVFFLSVFTVSAKNANKC